MKVTLHNTSKVITVNGQAARIWEGHTEKGVPCFAYVVFIATPIGVDQSEFERDLTECKAPSADVADFPSRMVS